MYFTHILLCNIKGMLNPLGISMSSVIVSSVYSLTIFKRVTISNRLRKSPYVSLVTRMLKYFGVKFCYIIVCRFKGIKYSKYPYISLS